VKKGLSGIRVNTVPTFHSHEVDYVEMETELFH